MPTDVMPAPDGLSRPVSVIATDVLIPRVLELVLAGHDDQALAELNRLGGCWSGEFCWTVRGRQVRHYRHDRHGWVTVAFPALAAAARANTVLAAPPIEVDRG